MSCGDHASDAANSAALAEIKAELAALRREVSLLRRDVDAAEDRQKPYGPIKIKP